MSNTKKMTAVRKTKAETMLRSGVPMIDIAKAVKVSVPTLYSYFPGGARGMRQRIQAEAKLRRTGKRKADKRSYASAGA